jgi:hypothetical protein
MLIFPRKLGCVIHRIRQWEILPVPPSRGRANLSKGMEPAKGIEPPTYGLRNQIPPLILNQINNLIRQIAEKSGKIRNPRATRLQRIQRSTEG